MILGIIGICLLVFWLTIVVVELKREITPLHVDWIQCVVVIGLLGLAFLGFVDVLISSINYLS